MEIELDQKLIARKNSSSLIFPQFTIVLQMEPNQIQAMLKKLGFKCIWDIFPVPSNFHHGNEVLDDYQMYSIKLSEVLPSSQNSELDISAPLTNSAPNAQIIQKTTFTWIGWEK